MITITQTSKLVQLRRDKGLKQKDVAKEVGITTSYYGMIELGKRTPSLIHAQKIASFFGVLVEDVFFADTHNKMLANDLETTGAEGR